MSLKPVSSVTANGDGQDRAVDGPPDTEKKVSIWRTVSRLGPFVLPHWGAVALALVLLLGGAAMDLIKPWPLKLTFDFILHQPALAGKTLYLLVGISVLVVVIAALEGLLAYLAAFYVNRAARTVVFDLRTTLFDHLQRLSLQFHDRRSTGELMARVTSDVRALRDVLTESVTETLQSVLFLVGMGSVLVWLDWPLTLVLISAAPLLFITLLVYAGKIKERARVERTREGALASVLHETLGSVRLVRVFNQEEEAKRRFHAQSAASLESGLAATLASERFSWMLDVIGGAVTAAVLGFGVQRVMAGAITAGTLIVFVSYIRNFYKSLRTAAKHVAKITKTSVQMERIVQLLDVKGQLVDHPSASHAPEFRGQIEFRDVRFEYQVGQPVLRAINLTIPAGQVTAIVGPTGSGKSTLVSLIPRLYDPTHGGVYIDGQDIRAWTLPSLRSQISVVLQEAVLLQASIAENIAYGRPGASPAEIEAAARVAHAHDFILELPEGYDTEVGERGATLSGGQRQRIAIARAIIRAAPIVILDEPLTGLDGASAAAVMAALEQLMKDKTVVIITHDLNLAQRADQVIVLRDGQVAQRGTHETLMETDGIYRQLFQAQLAEVMEQL